jgi:23S rRNA pseudouridine1911/1915/1917 synthase
MPPPMKEVPVTEELFAAVIDAEAATSSGCVRLDKVLARWSVEHEPGITRSHIAHRIRSGEVAVNGVVVTKSGGWVRVGDTISIKTISATNQPLSPYNHPLTVVYEDETLIVIDKPAGLTVHPGAGNQDETMLNALIHRDAGLDHSRRLSIERGGIVHRLDKDTSGLLVVARTPAAHAHLAQQFANRTVHRRYRALALATPRAKNIFFSAREGTIDLPIGRHPTHRTKMAVTEEGRPAVTHYHIMERFSWAMLLELRLQTGRTHQIRVHCAHRGAPLIGDPVYGSDQVLPPPLARAAHRCGRQALHAATLGFVHPSTGKELSFTSRMPADMVELVEAFR